MQQSYGHPPPQSPWGPQQPPQPPPHGHYPPPHPHAGHPGGHAPYGGQPGAYGAQGPYSPYGHAIPTTADPRVKSLNDRANTWLIVSLVGFWFGFWLITGPLAWVFAGRVREEFRRLGLQPSGTATAAWIVGIGSTVLAAFTVVTLMFLFATVVAMFS